MEQLELFSDADFPPAAEDSSDAVGGDEAEAGDEDDEGKPEFPLADILEAARRGAKIILL